jgi:glycosyltransferase involved in cell wall biosynthesis
MGKVRVWVDGTAFENENQDGVWRVFYEIMSRTANDIDYTLWLRACPKRPLPAGVRIYQDDGRAEISRYHLTRRLSRHWAKRTDPVELQKSDLFHSTGYTYPVTKDVRCITTVYDMIAESHFPICIRELRESIPVKLRSLERATMLPCISKSTASELLAFYPQFQSKISVVPLGADHLLRPSNDSGSVGEDARSPALFVGQRLGYKNFFNVLLAMRDPCWPKDITLDVVGSRWLDAEKLLLERLELSKRVRHLGRVTDEELGKIYRSARCLIFSSFQEGFGLPCLEAQANGCPLVCSDIPVFHEVAGDGAIYVDSRRGESMAQAVNELSDMVIRQELISRGMENVRSFSWQDTAERMAALYHQAATA